ncbi:hypothetical protein EDD85DRAFT_767214, partial [Armillaria nabsnona]
TLELDIPFRELSFEGGPYRQRTTESFDLMLIFINSMSSQMDDVKDWLDSVDAPLVEGPVDLNWGPIMKYINENPYEFFHNGGWSFFGSVERRRGLDASEMSDSESDFEAEAQELESSSSDEESA